MLRAKIILLFIVIAVLMCLSSCGKKSELFTEDERNDALNKVTSFFENSPERLFKVAGPVKVDDNFCLAIEVSGKYDNGTYPLDSFAIDPKSDSLYYKTPAGNYERFFNTPWYAYSVSPNKKYCIESVDIAGGGHGGGGDRYLGETRIMDMNTGEVLWEDSGCQRERYLWSDDSEYVARQYSGRIWTDISIIDTGTFEVNVLPRSEEILSHANIAAAPASGLYEIIIDIWLSDTVIKIDFGWLDDGGYWIQGSYNYSVSEKSFEVTDIEETARG